MRAYTFLAYVGLVLILQGCARTGNDVWEDSKTAGRHMNRGVRALGGKQGDSRQIHSRSEFESIDEMPFEEGQFQDVDYQDGTVPVPEDFIPLQDQANDVTMADIV